MKMSDADLRVACLAVLAELEREFFSVWTFTELKQSTALLQREVEAALGELQSRQLVGKTIRPARPGRKAAHGYQRIYVPDAKPLA
jgi:hypothetical protein